MLYSVFLFFFVSVLSSDFRSSLSSCARVRTFPAITHNVFVYVCVQLRVVRAFRSTLEDLEERRSVHSLRSLRSQQLNPHLAFLNIAAQKNLTPLAALHQQYQQQRQSAAAAMSTNALSEISFIDEDPNNADNGRGKRAHLNEDLPRPVHETRI